MLMVMAAEAGMVSPPVENDDGDKIFIVVIVQSVIKDILFGGPGDDG